MKYFWIITALILIYTSGNTKAQTMGFGCLGLSGVYGGYSLQNYNADELNHYLNNSLLPGANYQFEKSTGFRVGINLVRAKFENYFISVKGYFQFLKEEDIDRNIPGRAEGVEDKFELVQNHFGLGVDFGIPVFDFLDLKLVEGGVNFYKYELNYITQINGEKTGDEKFENDESNIGYYLGSGMIIHLVKDYISIEATANYNFYELNSLKSDRNSLIERDKLIETKGISGTVQLNLGFPL